jgi:hypothetical protein
MSIQVKEIKCPACGNDNGSLIETTNHLRTQMNCHCQVCSKSWVHIFPNIPREDIIGKKAEWK